MARKKKHWRAKLHKVTPRGTEAGTLIADPEAPKPLIRLIAYDKQTFIERQVENLKEISEAIHKFPVTWINVIGLGDAKIIEQLGDLLQIHQLALEDVLNVHQRAKLEEYGPVLYLVTHQAHCNPTELEQLSIFVGNRFVATFQEHAGDCLEPLRDRIRKNIGYTRERGADYLVYSILDSVIDSFFPLLESCGEKLDSLEDETVFQPDRRIVSKIHQLKRDLVLVRKTIWPLRDALTGLSHSSMPMCAETHLHLRDCQDHVARLMDLVETYRELAADLLDVYLSSLSNRLNEVMKIMAVVTTIFVPPTFVASLYGMNYAEEANPLKLVGLKWYFSFPFVIALVMSTFLLTLVFVWFAGFMPVSITSLFDKKQAPKS